MRVLRKSPFWLDFVKALSNFHLSGRKGLADVEQFSLKCYEEI